MDSFYDNFKAVSTDLDSIQFIRFAQVTEKEGDEYNVKEDNGTLHRSCLSLAPNIQVGDQIVLGFVNNSVYAPVILGNLKPDENPSGGVTIVTDWDTVLSDEKVPSEKLTKQTIDTKAPVNHASTGTNYGLGSNSNYGHVKTVNDLDSSYHQDGEALSAYQGKVLQDEIDAKPDTADIPTKTSDLTNDGDDGTNIYVKTNDSRLSDARTPISHTHQKSQITDLENKVTSWSTTTSNENIPSEKLVKDTIDLILQKITEIENGAKIVFYDPCVQNISNQYSTQGALTNQTVAINFNYDTDHYVITGTGGDYFTWFYIPNTRGRDNLRIRCKINLNNTSAYNQCMIGLTDDLVASSPTSAFFDAFRIRADNKRDFLHNSDQEVSGSSSSVTVRQRYVWLEMTRKSSAITGKVYNSDMEELSTYSYTTTNLYQNPYYFIGMNVRYNTSVKLIKEISVYEI